MILFISQVFCRVRPLNSMEEKNGSKFIPKFPADTEEAISVGVSFTVEG